MKAIDSEKSMILVFLRLQFHKHVIQCHENSLSTSRGVDDQDYQNLIDPLAVKSTNIRHDWYVHIRVRFAFSYMWKMFKAIGTGSLR